MDEEQIKKTLIIPKRIDNLLRIQSAIQNISQGQLIVDILTAGINPDLIPLLDMEMARPDDVAASEMAPKDKRNKK